ncbi:hypothetical protein P4654_04930 [Niallia taxi]|uniref:hypothetical protein n=1 Tax=Niallia taxi TaxID=2499688 RepID=UPI002E246053|nr:hypothetical protein [Niallia taxi]MED4119320.1 hypothetical protein [Niallia taxi]
MLRYSRLLLLSFFLLLTGCSNLLVGDKPPPFYIVMDGVQHETKLGSYCWKNGICSDVSGVLDLLENEPPISVKPNEPIQFKLELKPSVVSFAQVEHNNKQLEVPITNNEIKAPADKGIYYYAYSCWWMDEKEKDTSLGDAYYAFAIKVE